MAGRGQGHGGGHASHRNLLGAGLDVLEPHGFELRLINPEHYKAARGKKTDQYVESIAEPEDGRLSGSYVPPVAIRLLRDQPGTVPSWCSTILHREPHSTSVGAVQRQVGFGSQ